MTEVNKRKLRGKSNRIEKSELIRIVSETFEGNERKLSVAIKDVWNE